MIGAGEAPRVAAALGRLGAAMAAIIQENMCLAILVAGEEQLVGSPDIMILEGLNVLHTGTGRRGRPAAMFVSDFFDFSIYVDADEADIEQWYVERFLALRATVFRNPSSYFHRYAALSNDEAVETARDLWRTINLVNLRENVRPTRERATLVLEKGRDHAVRRVRMRKR